MTADDFCSALTRLGWTPKLAAQHLGSTDRAVGYWLHGQRPVPPYVRVLMHMFEHPQLGRSIRALALEINARG